MGSRRAFGAMAVCGRRCAPSSTASPGHTLSSYSSGRCLPLRPLSPARPLLGRGGVEGLIEPPQSRNTLATTLRIQRPIRQPIIPPINSPISSPKKLMRPTVPSAPGDRANTRKCTARRDRPGRVEHRYRTRRHGLYARNLRSRCPPVDGPSWNPSGSARPHVDNGTT